MCMIMSRKCVCDHLLKKNGNKNLSRGIVVGLIWGNHLKKELKKNGIPLMQMTQNQTWKFLSKEWN
jgi:hypothetical protein